MKRQSLALVGSVLFLAFVLDSAGQRTPTTPGRPPTSSTGFMISGTVRFDENGSPRDGIRVKLRGATGGVLAYVNVRSSGRFQFNNVPGGTYIVVLKEYEIEHARETVEISFFNRPDIIFDLRRSSGAVAGAAPVSVRELALPKKAREAYAKGHERLFEKKDSNGSIAHFQRAIAELPDYFEAYHSLGIAYAQTGRPAEAEAAYQRAIELSQGQYAPAYASKAALLCDQKRFAEAETSARRAVALDPQDWQGHFHLARALYGLNQVDEAEKSLNEAVQRKSENPDFHLLFANINLRRKDYAAVLKHLDEYLRLAPTGPASESVRQMRERVKQQLADDRASSLSPPAKATPSRIRVGGQVMQAKLISQPQPSYPSLAQQARIQGTVRLQAIIGKDGTIAQLEVLSGHPLLVQSALDAVRQWRYQPILLNGEPVEVVTTIDVVFTLTS